MALADDFYEGQRKSNRRIAEALAKEGMSSSPTSSHFVGANRVLQGLLGGLMQGRADAADKAQQDRISALLAGMPGLGEPSGGSVAASADLQDPATARAPDGMDRSITSGPRPPTAPPITMEPRPAQPSPYKLAGYAPINSQDTHHTPLDAMPHREQGLAVLRAAMGGQSAAPPMAGPTPPGAVPVQTEAIRPPAPVSAPAPAPVSPVPAPAASGMDPKMAAHIRSLLGSGDPRAEKWGMQLLLAEQQRMEARATRAAAEKPTWGKIASGPDGDIMGWINARDQKVTPVQLPGQQQAGGEGAIPPPPPGADPKKWREKQTEMLIAKQAGQPQKERAAGIVIGDIDRAIKIATESPKTATGAGGQLLQNFGGTQARNLSGLVDTIKANASFDRLQQMREASPTGAALGAVSDTELRLLGSAIGALDQSQTSEQFIENLRRVRSVYSEIINGPDKAAGAQPPAGTPDKATLKKKYGLE